MNKTKMRTVLEDLLAAFDEEDDASERPHHPPTAESILQELRASRRMLLDVFKPDHTELRASAPERKTAALVDTKELRKTADHHDYQYQGWQGMTSTERIAAKLDAELLPDPEQDILASTPAQNTASIASELGKMHPRTRVAAMSADARDTRIV